MSVRNIAKIRVIYADTDAMGIVYHTNYIKWFEVGRNELMRQLGFVYADIEKQGHNLPVTEVSCHYLLPARYDQILLVESEIDYIKRASIKFNYKIWDEQKINILAEGYTVHACINSEGKIRRIPQTIIDQMSKYEY